MKLRLTRRAVRNLADIADYLRERNPEAALRARAAIDKSLQNLVLFPHAGRKQEVAGVRKIATRRYPYLVYYRTDDAAGEIVVIAIRHSARAREHSDA
jgi:toxin ParE1/3/4